MVCCIIALTAILPILREENKEVKLIKNNIFIMGSSSGTNNQNSNADNSLKKLRYASAMAQEERWRNASSNNLTTNNASSNLSGTVIDTKLKNTIPPANPHLSGETTGSGYNY